MDMLSEPLGHPEAEIVANCERLFLLVPDLSKVGVAVKAGAIPAALGTLGSWLDSYDVLVALMP